MSNVWLLIVLLACFVWAFCIRLGLEELRVQHCLPAKAGLASKPRRGYAWSAARRRGLTFVVRDHPVKYGMVDDAWHNGSSDDLDETGDLTWSQAISPLNERDGVSGVSWCR